MGSIVVVTSYQTVVPGSIRVAVRGRRTVDQEPTDTIRLVSLNEHKRPKRHPALVQIEGYWETLRGQRLMPNRSEVDPRGLTGALEYAFVLERIAPGLARFRVAGRHLSDLMGMEVRGMPMSATFTPDSRPKLSTALEAAFHEPAQIRMQIAGEEGAGRLPLEGELLILPLRSDDGNVSRALGCIVMDGKIGRQPRRITIKTMQHKTLVGYADGSDVAADENIFAEAEAIYTAKPSDKTASVPYLKLIHSND